MGTMVFLKKICDQLSGEYFFFSLVTLFNIIERNQGHHVLFFTKEKFIKNLGGYLLSFQALL